MTTPRPLTLVPVTLAVAKAFVRDHHRNLDPPVGHRFSIGIAYADSGSLVGVAIIGRPLARARDDGHTAEVARLCLGDAPVNAASMLLGAARRAATAVGYHRLITYTRVDEAGTSLRAAGWHIVAHRKPRNGWDTPSRPRTHRYERLARTLWQVTLRPAVTP